MGTTVEKLTKVLETKESIRNAINSKGGTLTESNKFSEYATAINNLTSGGGSVELLKKVYVKGKGPVPNTGHLDKIFFNTKLTTDEVDSIIANANLHFLQADGKGFYFLATGDHTVIMIADMGTQITDLKKTYKWLIGEMNSETIYYTSPSISNMPSGWNRDAFTSFDTGEVSINDDLIASAEGIEVGTRNELLTELVYSIVDTEEFQVAKTLTDQYKLVEKNLKLDTAVSKTYTEDFINNINEDTKEISIIKNIEIISTENDIIKNIIQKTLTTYTNNNIEKIGSHIFRESLLTDVSFPKVVMVYNHSFEDCTQLVNVNMPLVTSISDYAFCNCNKLVDINFPLLSYIGKYSFQKCGLVNVNFPLVSSINTGAFQDCANLVDVNLPKLTYADTDSFRSCKSLQSITAPMLRAVGPNIFNDCWSLKNISFPQVTEVKIGGFGNNRELTEVILPKVTDIDELAFLNCFNLVKLFISQKNRVCILDKKAFEGCTHFTGIINSTYNPDGLKDGYIYVPASLLSQYKVANNWSTYATQIIGHEDLEAGATLPNYTTDSFTTQTWYSDEKLTTPVTSVTISGTYYCRLEA